MKRIITIILMCLPFVAFGQTTDYVDRLIKTDEYKIMANKITYKEPLEFNTLDEVFEFIGNSPKKEKVKITEDEELGIVSYKELDVVRTVSVYGMTFEASWTYGTKTEDGKKIELIYRPESANAAKEYLRYMQPKEEELRAILKAVKEDCAPNSEIKKETYTLNFSGHLYTYIKYYIGGYIITESNRNRSISIKKEKDYTL